MQYAAKASKRRACSTISSTISYASGKTATRRLKRARRCRVAGRIAYRFPLDKYQPCGKFWIMNECADAAEGNVFDPACPARAILEVLAEKWALLLVHMLAN